MATDGVKIIDGDTAHDIYNGIMDLYDNGANAESIREHFPFPQADVYDAFDYEVYTTAYALVMWEIGYIADDIINEVKKVIEIGACVKVWTAEHDAKSGKQREKELERLLKKISAENPKVRKRKKYKLVEKFLFDINDVLTFQLADGHYYATVILDIRQYRGNCTYDFGKITYKGTAIPTLEDIKSAGLLGRKIPSGHGMNMTEILTMNFEEIMKLGGIDEILKREAEKKNSYVLGMCMAGVDHRDLINFKNKFVKIGNLPLQEVCKNSGSSSGENTFKGLARGYSDLESFMATFKMEAFKIADLLVL